MAAPQVTPFPGADAPKPLSIDDDEPPLRWQRVVHLVPPSGLGIGRRSVLFATVTWVPIALWALAHGRFLHATPGEPLLQHYGVHIRCLVAIPLLIIGETTLRNVAYRYIPQFLSNGIVDDATRPAFESTVLAYRRWRDASLPWLFTVGVALAWAVADNAIEHEDAMSWAIDATGSLGFGGLWFAYVVRPVFVALLLGWLWRIVLLVALFVRLARLNLSFVPSHPDHAGGIGFVERLPMAFAPVGLALSATLSARWAHAIVYHGQTLTSFKFPAIMFAVVWSLLLLGPLVPLILPLLRAKRAALPSYSAMLAEQGRAARRRWIDGTTKADTPLLEPDGIGVIADASTMYDQVRTMRILPVSKTSLIGILLPIAVPMLVVVALQVPIRNLLGGLLKTLL